MMRLGEKMRNNHTRQENSIAEWNCLHKPPAEIIEDIRKWVKRRDVGVDGVRLLTSEDLLNHLTKMRNNHTRQEIVEIIEDIRKWVKNHTFTVCGIRLISFEDLLIYLTWLEWKKCEE